MTLPVWYVVGLWILWLMPFALLRPKKKGDAVQTAPKARWGIFFQTLGYWSIYLPARPLWGEPMAVWRLFVGTLFGIAGIWLAAAGLRHLGKQWRVNAALNSDHELITTGPYTIVRHPIYASMLCMMLMSIFLIGRLPWWPIGLVLFLVGIEIRVQVEDGLLRGRFGERFETWRSRVPAYLPLLR